MEELHAESDEPHVKIVRPSTRRKFLTAILGSGLILGLGSPALVRMAQNAQVALNTKDGPPDSDLLLDSFTTDLNFAAFVKLDHDEQLYIWSYQQQRMLTLPPAQLLSASAWSPDSKYLFYQNSQDVSSNSINVWDVQTWQKVSSYENEEYLVANMVCWSPDGSQIALFEKEQNKLLLLAAQPLRPLFTRRWGRNSQQLIRLSVRPTKSVMARISFAGLVLLVVDAIAGMTIAGSLKALTGLFLTRVLLSGIDKLKFSSRSS